MIEKSATVHWVGPGKIGQGLISKETPMNKAQLDAALNP